MSACSLHRHRSVRSWKPPRVVVRVLQPGFARSDFARRRGFASNEDRSATRPGLDGQRVAEREYAPSACPLHRKDEVLDGRCARAGVHDGRHRDVRPVLRLWDICTRSLGCGSQSHRERRESLRSVTYTQQDLSVHVPGRGPRGPRCDGGESETTPSEARSTQGAEMGARVLPPRDVARCPLVEGRANRRTSAGSFLHA